MHKKIKVLGKIGNLIIIRENSKKDTDRGVRKPYGDAKITSGPQIFIKNKKEFLEKNIDNSPDGVEDHGKEMGMSQWQLLKKLKAISNQLATTFIRSYPLTQAHYI